MWSRDGAFVAAALAKASYSDVCRRFFYFCSRVLTEDGYLFQHYNPDGSLARNWHLWLQDGKEVLPIQEDSTTLVLWVLWIHYQCTREIEFIKPLYDKLVKKSADFFCKVPRFRDSVADSLLRFLGIALGNTLLYCRSRDFRPNPTFATRPRFPENFEGSSR